MKNILLFVLLLSGCVSNGEKPTISAVTVEVPVYRPCALDVTRPRDLVSGTQVNDSILTKVNAMLQELVLWRVYGDQVEVAQTACASSNSPILPKSQ